MKRVLTFVVCMGAVNDSAMIFDVVSGHGAAAPLALLVVPLAMTAPLWYGVNIQVHAGRSSAVRRNSMRRVTLPAIGPKHGWRARLSSSLVGFGVRYSYHKQVLPIEVAK